MFGDVEPWRASMASDVVLVRLWLSRLRMLEVAVDALSGWR